MDRMPEMTTSDQLREEINALAVVLYPPTVAGLIVWYMGEYPVASHILADEIKLDAERSGWNLQQRADGFLEAVRPLPTTPAVRRK